MKSKSKFLWFYTIMLFSVALMLILFAGLTQQDYEKELETHESAAVGMKKSVIELTEQNTRLKADNDAIRSELDALKAEMEASAEVVAASEINDKLINAQYQYNYISSARAREILADVAPEGLTKEQLAIYNRIMK